LEIVIPELWQIILEIAAGAICGKVFGRLYDAIGAAAVVAFLLSIFLFLFGNPEAATDLSKPLDITTMSEKITIVMFALVNFILHAALFEIGAFPVNLATSRNN